jgi:hypothetical protein
MTVSPAFAVIKNKPIPTTIQPSCRHLLTGTATQDGV